MFACLQQVVRRHHDLESQKSAEGRDPALTLVLDSANRAGLSFLPRFCLVSSGFSAVSRAANVGGT